MLTFLVCVCLAHASAAQRYNERNVLPADTFPSSNTDDYDYYAEGYGFEEQEEANIYKWMVEEFPHPRNSSRFCNRMKPSNVCDPDMVLTKEHADHLDNSIRKLYKETPCICESCSKEDGGIVVGIALMKHMYLPYNIHPAKVIRSFAETLRGLWRLGKCDNDILIVVATTDRLSYTDVGRSTSNYLSIQEAHRIFVVNRAKFTAGNFFEGLRDILEGYYSATRTMDIPVRGHDDDMNVGMISGIIIGSITILGILLFIGFVLYRKCRFNKNEEVQNPEKGKTEGISSRSWSKKDIKVLFGSEKRKTPPPLMTKYHPCLTEENELQSPADGEEVIDFRLATPADTSFPNETQITNVTSDSEAPDKDLNATDEGISIKTFPATSRNNILVTDM